MPVDLETVAPDTSTDSISRSGRVGSLLRRLDEGLSVSRLFWITFLFGLILFCQLQFWKLPSTKDRANWDYFAQVISRGGVPYRDVVNIKTPLSAYIGAASIVATRPFSLKPVLATRLIFVSLSALTIAFTFLVGSLYSSSRRCGLLAALILSGIFMFERLNSDGIQPKTPMILFGLVALVAMMKDRPFVAGVFGMLSALSWQPGLLFAGCGGLAFSKYFTSWRDKRVLRLIAGAAIPLAMFLAHLLFAGALRDFYLWCFKFNTQVYGPRGMVTYAEFTDRFSQLLNGFYRDELPYFLQGAVGVSLAAVLEIYYAVKHGARTLLKRASQHQVIAAGLIYLAFCRIDMQGEQDLIPLLPFVAVFAAFLLITLMDRLIVLIGGLFERAPVQLLKVAGCVFLLMFIFYRSVRPIFSFEPGDKDLTMQEANAAAILSQLNPDERIWVHGQTDMLVVTGVTNSHKYTNFDHGKDSFLDEVEPGGFEGWFEKLKADRPRIVIFTRFAVVDRAEVFLQWLRSNYEIRSGDLFDYYLRKD